MKKKTCLVIQGGSLRGVHSSGVLKVFQDAGLTFDCVMGISAGALNGAAFLAGQIDRALKLNTEYIEDPMYIGSDAIKQGQSLINFDFLFQGRHPDIRPFDWKAFYDSPSQFICGATDAATGKIAYFSKDQVCDMKACCVASASLPMLTPGVKIGSKHYYDGGIASPILYRKAVEDGYGKIVLILTREKGYRKAKTSEAKSLVFKVRFQQHRAFASLLSKQHDIYNRQIEEIEEREAAGDPSLFIIRPGEPISVQFMERSIARMRDLSEMGQREGRAILPALQEWLS